MASFRFGRDPFRFEPSVFQPEARPEVWAPQTYKPTANDFRSNILASINQPPEVEEPSQPIGTEKKLFDTQSEQVNEYPMMDKFSDLLSQRPQREDYKPSVWRNIIGAVGGVSSGMLGKPEQAVANALSTTEKLRDVPFDRATSDWQGKIAGYGEGAKLELQKADKENKFLTMLNNARRTDITGERVASQNTTDMMNARTKQAAILQKAQEFADAGWKITSADGRMTAYNPRTQESQDIGEDMRATNAEDRTEIARGQLDVAKGRLGVARGQLGVAQQRANTGDVNANTAITRAEIARGMLENGQTANAIRAMDAETRRLQYGRQAENDIFNQTLAEFKYNRGDTAPKLPDMSPSQQTAATKLAIQQVVWENPRLMEAVDSETGMIDPTGDDETINELQIRTKQRLTEILDKAANVDLPANKVTIPKTTKRTGSATAPTRPTVGGGGIIFGSENATAPPVVVKKKLGDLR